jgi:hypothetical protein
MLGLCLVRIPVGTAIVVVDGFHGFSQFEVNAEIYLSMALQTFVGPWPLFQFLNLYTVGRTTWTGDQPVARPLPTHRTTQTQDKRTQTSVP